MIENIDNSLLDMRENKFSANEIDPLENSPEHEMAIAPGKNPNEKTDPIKDIPESERGCPNERMEV